MAAQWFADMVDLCTDNNVHVISLKVIFVSVKVLKAAIWDWWKTFLTSKQYGSLGQWEVETKFDGHHKWFGKNIFVLLLCCT